MSSLADILKELVKLQTALLATAMKKQKIIISGEINPLLSVLAEESKLLKKIKETDSKRIVALGEEAYQASLSQLIERQPDGEDKVTLSSIYKQLQHLFEELRAVNQTNQNLLKQSLAFTQYMMEQMLPVSEGSGLYSAGAATQETKNQTVRIFDIQA